MNDVSYHEVVRDELTDKHLIVLTENSGFKDVKIRLLSIDVEPDSNQLFVDYDVVDSAGIDLLEKKEELTRVLDHIFTKMIQDSAQHVAHSSGEK